LVAAKLSDGSVSVLVEALKVIRVAALRWVGRIHGNVNVPTSPTNS
jgi:hypothetical protein